MPALPRPTTWIALLRAVNVGGTGKLAMATLRELCAAAGFEGARTYIASGNVVFRARGAAADVERELARRLTAATGKPAGVLLRSVAELQAVQRDNPFPEAAPNRTVAIFLSTAPAANALADLRHRGDEAVRLGTREIYVHYGAGMASSKLVIPAARNGTARNLNTVAALVRMAEALDAA